MSLKIKGGYSEDYKIQPNRSVAEKNDGTLEGTVIFKTDRDRFDFLPKLDDTHPDDNRLECYQRSITYGNNNEVICTCSYFGLVASKTDKQISFAGGQNNDPITTHPDFQDFAGTPVNPKNGASFDPVTLQFEGFVRGDLQGVESYLTPSTVVSVSYWTTNAPKLKSRLTIHPSIYGFATPPDVVDFLLLDTPYRQVGNFYQVTEQYLGSGGERGWSELIYG